MKKRKENLIKPAESHPGETKAGIPPEHSDTAIDVQLQPDREADRFPIVGIGASAGGLTAFEAFFFGMPVDAKPGMAFVLMQHLAPDHKSILTDLIRRYTRMQVSEFENDMMVQINCASLDITGQQGREGTDSGKNKASTSENNGGNR